MLEASSAADVFQYFQEISAIPRGSGHTRAVSDYCVDFAKRQHLACRQDSAGNILILKDASDGYEDREPIILQGHLDMVTVHDAEYTGDMQTDGIALAIDGDDLYGRHTSLGGDDGIAVAMAMAVLADEHILHPALYVLFTVDEEIGMLGAKVLELPGIQAHEMINLDSEEEGVFLLGCAGGATATCRFPIEKRVYEGTVAQLTIGGLRGGHSGQEIDRERCNAIVLLGRYLMEALNQVKIDVGGLYGGQKDNAIADAAGCTIVVSPDDRGMLESFTAEFERKIQKEYEKSDPDVRVRLTWMEQTRAAVISDEYLIGIRAAMTQLPCGVIRRMQGSDMVETSANAGILRTDDTEIVLTYSVRSALASQKEYVLQRIHGLCRILGGRTEVSGVYPAWEYRTDSPLRDRMAAVYRRLYGEDPEMMTIHAGLECGILAEKIPELDCVSIGPDIADIHTVNERMSISSVERTWDFLKAVLKE